MSKLTAPQPSRRLSAQQTRLLHLLLDRLERSTGARMISVRVNSDRFPEYFLHEEPDQVRRWEEGMAALESVGWIRLDRGKHSASHLLERIRLRPEAESEIHGALGRMHIHDFRQRMENLIESHEQKARKKNPGSSGAFPEWWLAYLFAERLKWAESRPAAEERQRLIESQEIFYAAIEKILCLRGGMSWRQFAVTHFADSKKLDPFRSQIAQVLARFGLAGDGGIDEATALSHFGLVSKEEVILLRGPLRVNGGLELSEWTPFFAVSESMANGAGFSCDLSGVKGVLTIENEESFQDWCRQAPGDHGDWLCLYLGGFPSSGKVRFLKKIGSSGIPFHHWGDLDAGGLEIFLFLEKALGLDIKPFGMEPQWLDRLSSCAQALTSAEVHRLKKFRAKISDFHQLVPLVEKLLTTGLKLEQEAITSPGLLFQAK